MTITLDLPPEREALLKARAEAQGMTLAQWLIQITEQHVPSASVAHLQTSNPEAWIQHLEASVARLPKMPVLSDEAMSRESIYPDRS